MYRVDENSGTYTLAASFDVPYSPRYSNAQMIPVPQSSTSGDTSHTLLVLANTAQQHTWGYTAPRMNSSGLPHQASAGQIPYTAIPSPGSISAKIRPHGSDAGTFKYQNLIFLHGS